MATAGRDEPASRAERGPTPRESNLSSTRAEASVRPGAAEVMSIASRSPFPWFRDTFKAKLLDLTGCKVTFALSRVEAKTPAERSIPCPGLPALHFQPV